MIKKEENAVKTEGYRSVIISKKSKPQTRLMIGIPMTGLLRSEWVMARYGQVIPCNWSQVECVQWLDQYSPLNFLVADARNLIVKHCIEGGFERLLFIDHDVVLPPTFFASMNEYMLEDKVPIVGGLYFTKSVPSEPLVYRGRGNSYFANWKLGDKVWVDGSGCGSTLIHSSILKALYEESEEYIVAGQVLKKVFETPSRTFFDPETMSFNSQTGTEDLFFYSRIMKEDIFKKAGWPEYQRKKYPFLIDTKLFSRHIDWNGTKYPSRGEEFKFIKKSG